MSESCRNSECGSMEKCAGCASNQSGSMLKQTHKRNKIKNVIAVCSGKGGVGKSSITSMLACAFNEAGYKVGILDADITGPSIPTAFGVKQNVYGTEEGIIPATTKTGIKVMSINLMLDSKEQPVLWRGPVIGGIVTQFWTDVIWEEIDYLFVDMPPGTGDVPLTVFQSLPITGAVVVSSSQDLVHMIVSKALNMANQMNIKVLGIIENMSYFVCSDCHKKHYIFGESHIEEIADKFNIPVLAKLPLNQEIAKLCDLGEIESFNENPLKDIVDQIK